jgi:hypothetical protein
MVDGEKDVNNVIVSVDDDNENADNDGGDDKYNIDGDHYIK